MLSEYCSEIKKRHKISSGTIPKLITSLRDKEEICITLPNLKIVFRTWSKRYIEH